ncbi:hypothetical protein RCO28_36070 [Streptomyces sp. LHD-70]|uniref:hypothetical protein n=1 Tax=Streptomyces sp. LHD-70 TaxID=3072140 RepID=UPI00280FAF97|nr:hypothetical protein [Streptomyces sp. LHD-70]MDQ8707847.1 hypothetical protein [Streptomyces sp. LHD-70]
MNEQSRDTEGPLVRLSLDYVRAGRALNLALLDDIAARVRSAGHRDARYLEVTIDPETDDVTLHSIWSEQTSASRSRRLLRDLDTSSERWSDDPLALHQLVQDREDALVTGYLQLWGLVLPCPNYAYRNRSWVELPSACRVEAVADLVREYVPDAEGLVCSFRWKGHQVGVCLIAVIHKGGETTSIPCARCAQFEVQDTTDPWPLRVSHTLAHLLAQIHALPHLREKHLRQFGEPGCDDAVAPQLLPLSSATPTVGAEEKLS